VAYALKMAVVLNVASVWIFYCSNPGSTT